MNHEEAMAEALRGMGITDPFAKIAITEVMRELAQWTGDPKPGSAHERKLMELGALIVEHWGRP